MEESLVLNWICCSIFGILKWYGKCNYIYGTCDFLNLLASFLVNNTVPRKLHCHVKYILSLDTCCEKKIWTPTQSRLYWEVTCHLQGCIEGILLDAGAHLFQCQMNNCPIKVRGDLSRYSMFFSQANVTTYVQLLGILIKVLGLSMDLGWPKW